MSTSFLVGQMIRHPDFKAMQSSFAEVFAGGCRQFSISILLLHSLPHIYPWLVLFCNLFRKGKTSTYACDASPAAGCVIARWRKCYWCLLLLFAFSSTFHATTQQLLWPGWTVCTRGVIQPDHLRMNYTPSILHSLTSWWRRFKDKLAAGNESCIFFVLLIVFCRIPRSAYTAVVVLFPE